jgi:hypothetical protein
MTVPVYISRKTLSIIHNHIRYRLTYIHFKSTENDFLKKYTQYKKIFAQLKYVRALVQPLIFFETRIDIVNN